jgi:hypothetical protein
MRWYEIGSRRMEEHSFIFLVLHSTRDEGSNLTAGSVDYLLAQFAQWVFGPTSLPTFRVLGKRKFHEYFCKAKIVNQPLRLP